VALQGLHGDALDVVRSLLRNCSAAVAMEMSSPLTLICANTVDLHRHALARVTSGVCTSMVIQTRA